MGAWDNTSFVQYSDAKRLKSFLDLVFWHDGYTLRDVSELEWSDQDRRDMQYFSSSRPRFVSVAILPSEKDWLIVKTAPFDAMAAQPLRLPWARIAMIATHLQCNAFYSGMEDSCSYCLVEADTEGRCCMSGATMGDDEFYSEMLEWEGKTGLEFIERNPSTEESSSERDDLALLEAAMAEHGRKPGPFQLFTWLNPHLEQWKWDAEAMMDPLGILLTGKDRDYWSNDIQVQHLIKQQPLDIPGAIVGYYERTRDPDNERRETAAAAQHLEGPRMDPYGLLWLCQDGLDRALEAQGIEPHDDDEARPATTPDPE